MNNVNEAIKRLKANVSSNGHGEEGKPYWLPLAEEIRARLKTLRERLYHEVPSEVRKFHRAEAMSQGTNWELVAGANGKNRQAYRMHWVEEAQGMIKAIISDSEDEARDKPGPRPVPRLARRRTPEEDAEREGLGHNEWRKRQQVKWQESE